MIFKARFKPGLLQPSTCIGFGHKRALSTTCSPMQSSKPRALKEFSMEGKVTMVTGAARGLGNMFCQAFVESGCNSVAIVDLKQEEAQESAHKLVRKYVKEGLAEEGELHIQGFGCDVASEESVQRVFTQIESQLGPLDTVVTAASKTLFTGIVENFPAVDYPADKVRRLYDINVHGSFFCAREAAKSMLRRKATGSIILISSMSANIVNQPQLQTPYNASKAAVKHMASSLAVEWAKAGIRVNAISPGYMMTALTAKVLEENQELKKSWQTLTPMGRMGNPEELKGAVVFLASDASSYVTGSELKVDGGYCCI
ncbi:NAD(P)-binding protein [Serendipita vermifera]|nr:NAD(P)-binding protein [Serendipita vermifera]